MKKIRLDALLVEKGLITGRDKAKAIIMAGDVYVDGQKETKAGTPVAPDCVVEVRGEHLRYVSRGGLKLEKALEVFSIDLYETICMDMGASTGGFTDCMLQNGAEKVYAVDVGYGQLAWEIRQHSQVIVMERTNVRYVTREEVPDPLDFVGIDVSFISLALVLPTGFALLKEQGQVVCLIKPQFEAGRDKVGKRGVVREKSTHIQVIQEVMTSAEEIGFSAIGLDFSPVTGPEGNIEYLLHLSKQDGLLYIDQQQVEDVVNQAHTALVSG